MQLLLARQSPIKNKSESISTLEIIGLHNLQRCHQRTMLLSDLIEIENSQSEISFFDDQQQQQNVSQSHDAERAQSKFEVKSVDHDNVDQMHIEALKDVKNVDEALSLLRNLRDGSQISDSAHDSLSKAFKLLSKEKKAAKTAKAAASHLDKVDRVQTPSERRKLDAFDDEALAAAGIKVPKRKSASRPFKHPSSKRQQLTSDEAAEIYSMRPEFAKGSSLRRGCMVKSKMIAPHFGVTPKTVRDIWHGRTWITATKHLWTEEEITHRANRDADSDEEKNDFSGTDSPTGTMDRKRHPLAHNMMAHQAMMGGMPFHMPFHSGPVPSAALAHPFSVGQQQAALLSHGIYNAAALAAQQASMGFPGCHPGWGAHSLVI
eukprot:2367690-Rhodomonas_salina.3